MIDSSDAQQYQGDKLFLCKYLEGVTCRTKEDPRAWDDDATRRVSGKDKRPPVRDRIARFSERPLKMQQVALLADKLGVHPSQFEERKGESFVALLEYATSEDAIHADQAAEKSSMIMAASSPLLMTPPTHVDQA